jgi:hypothetical protein
MAEEGSTTQIEGKIAALEKLEAKLAHKVRDEGAANPRSGAIPELVKEYNECGRELRRLKKVLRKRKG